VTIIGIAPVPASSNLAGLDTLTNFQAIRPTSRPVRQLSVLAAADQLGVTAYAAFEAGARIRTEADATAVAATMPPLTPERIAKNERWCAGIAVLPLAAIAEQFSCSYDQAREVRALMTGAAPAAPAIPCPPWCPGGCGEVGGGGSRLHERSIAKVPAVEYGFSENRMHTAVVVEAYDSNDADGYREAPSVMLAAHTAERPPTADMGTLNGLDDHTIRHVAAWAMSGGYRGEQVRLTPDQAEQLGRALIEAATLARQTRPGDDQ
jgi:hypothetical protein